MYLNSLLNDPTLFKIVHILYEIGMKSRAAQKNRETANRTETVGSKPLVWVHVDPRFFFPQTEPNRFKMVWFRFRFSKTAQNRTEPHFF